MLIDVENSRWVERRTASFPKGRPMLCLDRDGVLVDEVQFLSKPADVKVTRGIGAAVATLNRAAISVVVVTNQSGIGRGLFDWHAFQSVETEIARQLGREGGRIDAVLACGIRPDAEGPGKEGWRKPGAGMVLEAIRLFEPDLSKSAIIGDRLTDIEAGYKAGLPRGWLVETGYGAAEGGRLERIAATWTARAFVVARVPDAAAAIDAYVRGLGSLA